MTEAVLQVLGPSAGGIRRHVAYLSSALSDRGWQVAIAGPAGVMDGLAHLDVTAPVAAGPSAIAARRALGPAVAAADLVHAHGLTAGWIASLVSPRAAVVVTVHNLVLDEAAGWRAPLLRALEDRLPQRVSQVIAVSDAIAERFRGAQNVRVIPAVGAPPRATRSQADVRAAYGIGADAPLAVTVARLHPQKGIDVWLDALADVRAQVPSVRALVVGDGPDRAALAAQAAALGLSDTVVWAGAREDAADELAAGDIVVVPSRWEGSPLVVREAITLGSPLVSTQVGTIGEWIDGGRNGWLVPVNDPAALAQATVEALGNPTEARARAERARADLGARGMETSSFDAIEAVYREVLR